MARDAARGAGAQTRPRGADTASQPPVHHAPALPTRSTPVGRRSAFCWHLCLPQRSEANTISDRLNHICLKRPIYAPLGPGSLRILTGPRKAGWPAPVALVRVEGRRQSRTHGLRMVPAKGPAGTPAAEVKPRPSCALPRLFPMAAVAARGGRAQGVGGPEGRTGATTGPLTGDGRATGCQWTVSHRIRRRHESTETRSTWFLPPLHGPSALLWASSGIRPVPFAAAKTPVATLRPAGRRPTAHNCPLDRARSRQTSKLLERETRGVGRPHPKGVDHWPARGRVGIGQASM